MRSFKHIFGAVYLIVILCTLFSCATLQNIPREGKDQIIDVGSYTVGVPSGDDWKIAADRATGQVQFRKQPESNFGGALPFTFIRVSYDVVLKQEMWKLSDEEIATQYRDSRSADVRIRAATLGDDLYDVKRDVVKVDEKTLYALSYKLTGGKVLGKDKIGEDVMYLYFPPNFRESHRFFLFRMTQTTKRDAQVPFDVKPIFEVIRSFHPK